MDFSKKRLSGFAEAAQSLKLYRRAELLDEQSGSTFSADELGLFQHLTARKDSIMQKRKIGNLEVSAIRFRPASARQVSAFSHGCMSTF
jgi:hypothetical protein